MSSCFCDNYIHGQLWHFLALDGVLPHKSDFCVQFWYPGWLLLRSCGRADLICFDHLLVVKLMPYPFHVTIYTHHRGLFPAHFTSRHYDEQGNEIVDRVCSAYVHHRATCTSIKLLAHFNYALQGHVNCFYQGWVEGHPDWRVTMSTCHGLQ